MIETMVIRPRGVGDFTDELDEVAAAAREAAPDLKVVVEEADPMAPGRRGVIAAEILEVTFSLAAGYAFNAAADAIVARARAGWKARHRPRTWPRTRLVKILGPNGEVLREVKVSDDPDLSNTQIIDEPSYGDGHSGLRDRHRPPGSPSGS